ncbi:hypothetical protein GCM10010528_00890 [Gordonia defluvii]|jgi:hypothetical protein|uniref:Uncharacterized protein n=1 Tax=Gordonia defluvii TaxID=283718 RepID=A0ABN3YCZ2_9ACTN|nr:hypothetical protein [Gordonia sp. UBA5067]
MSDDTPQRREIDFDKLERNKDFAQEAVQTTATRVGRIATIITGAVVDVAREVGDLISDGFEMREAAKRAKHDSARLDRLARERLGEFDPADELSEAAGGPEELIQGAHLEAIEARRDDEEQ